MNSLQELRRKHLQILFSNFPVLKMNVKEKLLEIYRVKTSLGVDIILEIGGNFPEISPVLSLDSGNDCFKIVNWNLHSSLVGILNQIIQELQKEMVSLHSFSFLEKIPQNRLDFTDNSQKENLQTDSGLTLEELKELDMDLLAFDDYYESLPLVKKRMEDLELQVLQNYNLASSNKQKEKEYFSKVNEYQELFVRQGELRKEFDSLYYKFQNAVMVSTLF